MEIIKTVKPEWKTLSRYQQIVAVKNYHKEMYEYLDALLYNDVLEPIGKEPQHPQWNITKKKTLDEQFFD